MVKRHYSNLDINWMHANIKAFVAEGNASVARVGTDQLRAIWVGLNEGQIDIDDIDLLYRKLRSAIRMVIELEAKQYDERRKSNG